jgi:predicted nucleic acid-binding Zn ribbon protein
MAETRISKNHCSHCGKDYAAEILVCPECKQILVTPGERRGTAPWVIVLLLCIILALLIYAIILSRQFVVLHQF